MSLDLSVVSNKRISKEKKKALVGLLAQNGILRYLPNYYITKEGQIYIHVEVLPKPEKDDYWEDMDALIGKIGFMPKLEIILYSRHNKLSHQTSYNLALEIAALVDGIIYDHQMHILYNCHGRPLNPEDADGWDITYGKGCDLFTAAMGCMGAVLETQEKEETSETGKE